MPVHYNRSHHDLEGHPVNPSQHIDGQSDYQKIMIYYGFGAYLDQPVYHNQYDQQFFQQALPMQRDPSFGRQPSHLQRPDQVNGPQVDPRHGFNGQSPFPHQIHNNNQYPLNLSPFQNDPQIQFDRDGRAIDPLPGGPFPARYKHVAAEGFQGQRQENFSSAPAIFDVDFRAQNYPADMFPLRRKHQPNGYNLKRKYSYQEAWDEMADQRQGFIDFQGSGRSANEMHDVRVRHNSHHRRRRTVQKDPTTPQLPLSERGTRLIRPGQQTNEELLDAYRVLEKAMEYEQRRADKSDDEMKATMRAMQASNHEANDVFAKQHQEIARLARENEELRELREEKAQRTRDKEDTEDSKSSADDAADTKDHRIIGGN